MRLITLHVPEPFLAAIEELISRKATPNRADYIRFAIRDALASDLEADLE